MSSEALKNFKNTKYKIKKELEEPIINSKNHDNTEIKEKGKMIERPEYSAKVFHEFKEIIRSNKKNIVWLPNQQGIKFQKFKQKEKFTKMITEFGSSRSIISLKIAIVGLTNKCPKMKSALLSPYFLKKHIKVIKAICKQNASEFK